MSGSVMAEADAVLGYDEELPFRDSLAQLAKIEELTGVSERFKSDVRTVALRIMSVQDQFRCFYGFCQLSQLGTGFGGGRQSERDDHVRLDFITGPEGESIYVVMAGNSIEIGTGRKIFGKVSPFKASYADQDELREIVDSCCLEAWIGNI